MTQKQGKVTRDLALFVASLTLLAFEILLGGGRPTVLTALCGLLLSPVIMRVDEARKKGDTAKPAPEARDAE